MNSVVKAISDWNNTRNTAWSLEDAYDPSKISDYNQFLTGFLFPKVAETILRKANAYNRFQDLVQEDARTALLNEEVAILDTVPTYTNFSKDDVYLLDSKTVDTATGILTRGAFRKFKFTINLLQAPRSFSNLADVANFALQVYQERLKMINVIEEKETLGMLADRASSFHTTLNTSSVSDTILKISEAIDMLQQNNKHNEVTDVFGEGKEYTDTSLLDDILIITSAKVKRALRDSVLANSFHVEGIDISANIRGFAELGGVYRVTKNKVVTEEIAAILDARGMYNYEKGDTLAKGTILTFEVKGVETEEIKLAETDAIVIDKRGLYLRQDTSGLKSPQFTNPETMNVTTYMHYASSKNLSLFTPKILITSQPVEQK